MGRFNLIRNRGNTTGFRQRGDAARNARDWPLAAELYAQHVALNPGDFEIWVQLGHARKEAGDLDRASEAYSRARGLRPRDADLLLNIGRLLRLTGKPQEALAALRESNEIDGNAHALNEIQIITGNLLVDVAMARFDLSLDQQMQKILISGFFDPAWYLEKYPDINSRAQGPLEHFAKHGAYEWRSPGPNFDTEWYLLQNPDLIPGTAARALNPLLHYLDYGAKEGRTPAPPTTTFLATVKALVDSVFDIDPLFYSRDKFINVKGIPVIDPTVRSKSFAAFTRAFERLEKPYDHVIVIPSLIHGGAERMALNMAQAIVSELGNRSVLVVAADYPQNDAADWLPPGVDFVMLQDTETPLSTQESFESLLYFLQAVGSKCVINVNSMACWEIFRTHGRVLSQSIRLYGCAFCRDYNNHNFPGGYADTHIRDTLPSLAGLISDNSIFFKVISDHFTFPEYLSSRYITLYNPTPAPRHQRTSPTMVKPRTSFKVLWASRFTRQKNISLLVEIIRSAPEVNFEIWGRGDLEAMLRQCAHDHGNVTLMGQYSSFVSLPLEQYDAFLYTSLWDGIPNVLLEAAGANLPIVAPDVGGIGELVDANTGWLVEDLADPTPYVVALRAIRDDRRRTRHRQEKMQERLATQHGWDGFVTSIKQSGILEAHA